VTKRTQWGWADDSHSAIGLPGQDHVLVEQHLAGLPVFLSELNRFFANSTLVSGKSFLQRTPDMDGTGSD
jgi:hypothetical protein